jgi:hypothetical protein
LSAFLNRDEVLAKLHTVYLTDVLGPQRREGEQWEGSGGARRRTLRRVDR